jgi:hypothetical protein
MKNKFLYQQLVVYLFVAEILKTNQFMLRYYNKMDDQFMVFRVLHGIAQITVKYYYPFIFSSEAQSLFTPFAPGP